jgi:hypothetical protein
MNESELRQKFIESAYLADPHYLFDSEHASRELASSLIAKCEKLAGNETDEFYTWLGRVIGQSANYCFYGSALVLPEPSDVDMMLLAGAPGSLFCRKPSFIHVLETQRCPGDLAKNWGSFFLGSLLFPGTPPEFILNIVDYCRQTAFSSPFFGGGYGENLTYAAFKSIGKVEFFEPHEWESVRHLERFKLEYRYFDGTNMQTVSYSVNEVHDQIRKKLCMLEEKEMRALALAATRRLGVKAENRANVAETFISELKKMKR